MKPTPTLQRPNPIRRLVPLALLSLAAFCLPTAQATPIERELVSRAARTALQETLEKTAAEAAEKSAAAAIRTLGKEGAREAVERGGLQLLEAGARHGDEVWGLVRRAPEITHYVASKPGEALGLVRRFGDDAVRLEARAPGMAETAAALFGPKSLAVLAKADPGEINRLVGYAQKATSAEARTRLWELWHKRGSGILATLDKHKLLILTSGLTLAILDTAHSAGGGLKTGFAELSEKAPYAFETVSGGVAAGIQWSAIILSSGFVGWLLLRTRSKHRRPIP